MNKTITCVNGINLETGDYILVSKSDTRWWMRLWHWILRRDSPTIQNKYICNNVVNNTTIEI